MQKLFVYILKFSIFYNTEIKALNSTTTTLAIFYKTHVKGILRSQFLLVLFMAPKTSQPSDLASLLLFPNSINEHSMTELHYLADKGVLNREICAWLFNVLVISFVLVFFPCLLLFHYFSFHSLLCAVHIICFSQPPSQLHSHVSCPIICVAEILSYFS